MILAKKKDSDEDKITVRKFKDGSSNFWVGYLHLYLNEQNEICFACGGIMTEEHLSALQAYVKRNKVTFIARDKPEIEIIQRQYNEKITFGAHSGKTVSELFIENKKYLIWVRDKYNFSVTQNKLKQEIIDILK